MHALNSMFTSWPGFGSALANHLWQSTLFAAAVTLLALVLKRNRAQLRYKLWLIASVKFLLPFSLLVSLGSRVARQTPAGAAGFVLVAEQIGRPFAPLRSAPGVAPAAAAVLPQLFPALLLLGWLLGFMAVLLFWWLRWRRVMSILRVASPVESGRELEMLRRLEQSRAMAKTRLSLPASTLEPGIVGIFRPILLLPQGIANRLTDAQLEAVMTHELCHVRRRDNLAAATHMLVEALFWFHPLVWWMGARLLAERERACDEEVLRLGNPPQAYAEGILKICEFYLESPLVCVAGVTGSNLKQRIEAIMIHRIAIKLNLAKKLLLTVSGTAALMIPIVLGLLHPAAGQAQQEYTTSSPKFDEVSIRPGATIEPGKSLRTRFQQNRGVLEVENLTLRQLIGFAYGLSDSQISGGPDWISSDLYDLTAKGSKDLTGDQYRLALQNLLAEHFKVAAHHELKNLPVYELVLDRNGAKLAPAGTQDKKDRIMVSPVGRLEAVNVKLDGLARYLQNYTGGIVIDKTGLTGAYDFNLTADGLSIGRAKSNEAIAALLKALPEQLGLELKPQNKLTDSLIIDHAERIFGSNNPETSAR